MWRVFLLVLIDADRAATSKGGGHVLRVRLVGSKHSQKLLQETSHSFLITWAEILHERVLEHWGNPIRIAIGIAGNWEAEATP